MLRAEPIKCCVFFAARALALASVCLARTARSHSRQKCFASTSLLQILVRLAHNHERRIKRMRNEQIPLIRQEIPWM